MCFIRYGTPPTAHPAQLHTGLFRINPHSCEASHAGNKPNASKPSTTPVEVIKDDTLSCMLPSGHKPRTKRATNAHSLSSRPAPPWRRVTPVQRHGCHAAMRTALQHMTPFENSLLNALNAPYYATSYIYPGEPPRGYSSTLCTAMELLHVLEQHAETPRKAHQTLIPDSRFNCATDA